MEQQNLIRFVLFGLIVVVYVIALWPVLQKLAIRWDGGDNNYCYLVVPLFHYLLWDRKKQFCFSEFSWNSIGFFPLLAAIIFILLGELGSVEMLMYIGLWVFVVGLAFLLHGRRIRHLAFSLIILAFIIPLPPYINRMLTFQLKLFASTIATHMLRLSGVSVFQDGNIIDLGVTQLQVVEACSGLRYLMPLFMLALLIGYFLTKGCFCISLGIRGREVQDSRSLKFSTT